MIKPVDIVSESNGVNGLTGISGEKGTINESEDLSVKEESEINSDPGGDDCTDPYGDGCNDEKLESVSMADTELQYDHGQFPVVIDRVRPFFGLWKGTFAVRNTNGLLIDAVIVYCLPFLDTS